MPPPSLGIQEMSICGDTTAVEAVSESVTSSVGETVALYLV